MQNHFMNTSAAFSFYMHDNESTIRAGQTLANVAIAGGVIFLQGTLGAGKTTFSRGLVQGLGHQGAVKSPTYTLVEPYENLSPKVFHFDLYRLGSPEELEYMGIRDFLQEGALALIEWPSQGEGYLPEADVVIDISVSAPGRTLNASAQTLYGESLIQAWQTLLSNELSSSINKV